MFLSNVFLFLSAAEKGDGLIALNRLVSISIGRQPSSFFGFNYFLIT